MNPVLVKIANLEFQKILLGALAIGAFYYFMLYNDGESIDKQIDAVSASLSKSEAELTAVSADLKKMDKMNAEIEKLRKKMKFSSSHFPETIAIPDMLRLIDSSAASSSVSIKAKEPKKVETQSIYDSTPIKISAEGKFNDLVMFMYNLTQGDHPTRIVSLSMNPIRTSGKELSRRLSLEMVLTAHRYLGDEIVNKVDLVPVVKAVKK
jgi:Tfp pilus assembly protein PilO